MNSGEEKALHDIEVYGCHVIYVLAEEELPPFAYSVGIESTSQAPELIVIGLKRELAHSIVNSYNKRIRTGERFEHGRGYSDFVGGFDCQMRPVDSSHYRDYLGWCRWFYKGDNFRVMQLVYPTTSGIWPWEPQASEWFRKWQPLLDKLA
jgi:hypothetical protein